MRRRVPLRRGGYILRHTRLRPISPRHGHKLRVYYKKRDAYMESHPWCEVAPALWGIQLPAEDLHHRKGRWGDLLTDEHYFMAVSRRAHDWIHTHGDLARGRGWLGS